MTYIMFQGKIEESKADNLVKKALIERNYSRDLELKRYLLDNHTIDYFIQEDISYHGKKMPKITRLTISEYLELLGESMSLQYGTKYHIYPMIQADTISYQVAEACVPNHVKMRRKQRGK